MPLLLPKQLLAGASWREARMGGDAALVSVAACTLLAMYLVRRAFGDLGRYKRQNQLARLAQRKRAERDASRCAAVEAGLGVEGLRKWAATNSARTGKLAPDALAELTATELLTLIASKRVSSEYVVRAYVARAIAIGEALGTNAEEQFTEAVAEAALCDAELARGKRRGPLHGLPISVKDQFDMAGCDSTCGLSARCYRPAARDSLLVSLCRQAGAIPFVRTNVPQLLMLPEAFNAIWGVCRNPYDPSRSSGGSSGGEGALIAARGSPLGLGTDIGGSIRIPAVLCGICGFKPTVGRLSSVGIGVPRLGNINGQKEVRSAPGPMGRSVADLELLMRVWCDGPMHEADVTLPRVKWDAGELAKKGKLRFGMYRADGWFDAAPACARAVDEAASALRAAGHQVVEFAPEEMAEAAVLYIALLSSDGKFRGFLDALEGEALNPTYDYLRKVSQLPSVARRPLAVLLRGVLGDTRGAKLVVAGKQKSARDYWLATVARDKLRASFLRRWKEAGIDALICPGLGVPAFPHGASLKLNQARHNNPRRRHYHGHHPNGTATQACSYTFIFNNFDMPAGTVPVTSVRGEEEAYVSKDKDPIAKAAVKACVGSAGLPVGVQVVAAPWRDELCLRAMRELESALGPAARPTPGRDYVPPPPPSTPRPRSSE